MHEPKYPIGQFEIPALLTEILLSEWISTIAALPDKMAREVGTLSDLQLDTPYREGGWTLRQVVHHCADSHMNAFCRFKLAMTEEKPVIKPYEEARCAALADSKNIPVDASLTILTGLHKRWAVLMKSLREEERHRAFIHPEHGREISLQESIGMHAWHGEHHLAHITSLKKKETGCSHLEAWVKMPAPDEGLA